MQIGLFMSDYRVCRETMDGWQGHFDRPTGSFMHYDFFSHVYTIAEDPEGDLWLGSKDPCLLRLGPTEENPKSARG